MNLAPAETLFDEVTDFLGSRPTPEEIINFTPSDELNTRLHDLLDKNQAENITPEERAELDRFLQIDHLFTLLKAKARLKVNSR
jgi:hypothetical protein